MYQKEKDIIISWLKERSRVIKAHNDTTSVEDLGCFKAILKDVQLLGLGESTHGSHEFLRFKHRLLRYLVTEMDYKVFVLETGYSASLCINEFVMHGTGDPRRSLSNQGLTFWDTSEMLEMVEWMWTHNRTLPAGQRVQFLGFDILRNEVVFDYLRDYFCPFALDEFRKFEPTLKRLCSEMQKMAWQSWIRPKVTALDRDLRALREFVDYLRSNRRYFLNNTSREEYQKTRRHLIVLGQFFDVLREFDFSRRNLYLAENIRYILNCLEDQRARIVISAHNEHIATGKFIISGRPTMGAHLKSLFGEAYYGLAFVFDHGYFRAMEKVEREIRPGKDFHLGAAQPQTLEWFLARTKVPSFVIDFPVSVKNATVKRWLTGPVRMRSLPAVYSPALGESLVPKYLSKEFDGLIFFNEIRATRPNLQT